MTGSGIIMKSLKEMETFRPRHYFLFHFIILYPSTGWKLSAPSLATLYVSGTTPQINNYFYFVAAPDKNTIKEGKTNNEDII